MIYVMSDIHGNLRRFRSVMGQIDLRPEDTLYVLGDVIDRYPDGINILRSLMKMPNVKMLLGNHEYMMLNTLDTGLKTLPLDKRDLWYRNGGRVTHDSMKRISKAVRREIFDYLRALPLNIDAQVNGQKYKLVHGAPVQCYPDDHSRYESPVAFAVWRRWKASDPDLDDAVLIFGHTSTIHYQEDIPMRIWYAPNERKIGLDCGCGYAPVTKDGRRCVVGRLACLRLDDMQEFYSEEDIPDQP